MSQTDPLPIEAPAVADETPSLLGSLERQRRIVAWKCGGLDTEGLSRRLDVSTMTLGGLLKHLTAVEDDLFHQKLAGRSPAPPWDTVDWDADPDWEWRTAATDPPEYLYSLWADAVDRSRAAVRAALAEGGLDQPAMRANRAGEHPLLRRLMIDAIEEYARHAGHADLLREAVDGLVGEEPSS